MRASRLGILALLLVPLGCGQNAPLQPASDASASIQAVPGGQAPLAPEGRPAYEEAYYDDTTVLINAIDLPQHTPSQAQADLYTVVYPNGWESMNLDPPQCNPCDHAGDGVDPTDYHDHVLDSIPRSPGHGEFRPLWHVYAVVPAYNGNSVHDDAVSAAYAAHLPARSEEEVDALLGDTLQDQSPVAAEIDLDLYFLCSVVDPHAAG